MFDSGIGGLTVLKEVRDLLPSERIVYIGDTARVPYGNKSPQTVTKYALECARFLLTKDIKILVVACNTSAALSLAALKKSLSIPVIGVIDPGAKVAVRHTSIKRIGVIGTKATIKSGAYERAIKKLDPRVAVLSKPCPLFVPIVEEGLEGDEIAYRVAEKYLKEFKDAGIDVLVMGCTHYPILEEVLAAVMGPGVSIVHTGRETAREVRSRLAKDQLLSTAGRGGCEYYVTDSPESFKEVGGRFLGHELKRVTLLRSLETTDLPNSA
jgi:glutamate racemase